MALVEQAQQYAACTPSDATTFSQATAIFVGVGGDVALMPLDGDTAITFKNVPSGTFMPVQCLKVMSTNTTATNIVLLTNEA